MTPAILRDHVTFWQRKLVDLGVGHFRIKDVEIVDETTSGPHANATTFISDNYDVVSFEFTKQFLRDEPDEEIDRTIVHEWVHVAMRDWDRIVDRLGDWMPNHMQYEMDALVDAEREGLVDRLATCLHNLHKSGTVS